jgi:hypothetical protein
VLVSAKISRRRKPQSVSDHRRLLGARPAKLQHPLLVIFAGPAAGDDQEPKRRPRLFCAMKAVEIDQVLLAGGRLRPGQIAGVLCPNLFLIHRPVVHLHEAADHPPVSLAKEEHSVWDQPRATVAGRSLEGGVLTERSPLDREQLQIGPSMDRLPNGQQELGDQDLVDDVFGSVPLLGTAASPVDAGGAPGFALGRERLPQFSDASAGDVIDFRKERTDAARRRRGQVAQRLQFFQVSPRCPIGTQ